MRLLSPEQSLQMRNFILNNKAKVITSESIYDVCEEPSELEDKKRAYLLDLALQEFSDEVFIIYFPERLDLINGFPKIWQEKMNNQCLIILKNEIKQIDEILPEYYIFNKDGSKFIFVDAEGEISLTKYDEPAS